MANRSWLITDTTVVGVRTYAGIPGHRIMRLNSLGSEYWVVRAAGGLTQSPLDLLARVSPEGVFHVRRDFSNDGVTVDSCVVQDGRLVASVVAYSVPAGAPGSDSLWAHPEWAKLALDPVWVDVDSAAGGLE